MMEDDGRMTRLKAGAYNEGYQDAYRRDADRREYFAETHETRVAEAYREAWERGRRDKAEQAPVAPVD
ncbi:hypothetical protein EXE59_16590 [Nocardioides eburneiflavus]|uniref:Uncharacterized protein n=1 Tax=Nocardioides eburneiflavus TaxID=2518372 RepID=A0A4Z1BVU3_9ACTN|nr:hypothetical protein [Nocardioides eburneiflavus]TGN65391.1 hypothetical protein EXE59_16590 [Nocardioides eburneiflavus]